MYPHLLKATGLESSRDGIHTWLTPQPLTQTNHNATVSFPS